MKDLPEPRPRPEIDRMAPYRPPPEGRRGKLRLDFNENTLGCSRAVLRVLRETKEEDLAAYPEYGRITRSLARHLGLEPDMLVLTNGTDEAIRGIYTAFLSPGDRLILPSPTFALFRIHADIMGIEYEKPSYGLDLSFPLQTVLSRIEADPAPRLLVLVNPNNPTGTAIEAPDVERLITAAARRGTVVLLDEAYWEFSGIGLVDRVKRFPNLLVLRTFSKAHGLAGLRVGVVAGPPALVEPVRKVMSPYGVSALAVAALQAALRSPGHVKRYVGRVAAGKRVLEAGLDRLGVQRFPTRANFLMARFGAESGRVMEALRQEGVLVRQLGRGPVTRGCLRVGIGPPRHVRSFLRILKGLLRDRCLLFDMDGVLVDVSASYRAAIATTVEELGGGKVTFEAIHQARNAGRFADDWALTRAILAERGVERPMAAVKRVFQKHYLGAGSAPGLREREEWLLPRALLARLARRHPMGIVTARPRQEALWTLGRFDVERYFQVVVARESVGPLKNLKPSPYGLLKARRVLGTRLATYVGDSTSDMEAAVDAGFRAVGCRTPGAEPAEHDRLMLEAGADRLIGSVTQIAEEPS